MKLHQQPRNLVAVAFGASITLLLVFVFQLNDYGSPRVPGFVKLPVAVESSTVGVSPDATATTSALPSATESAGSQVEDEVKDGTDWSRYAYVQYVTNSDYLCNSVMIFEALHRMGSKPDRVMMYPSTMVDADATDSNTREGKLVLKARDEYNVKLKPIDVLHRPSHESTWADSFTKLLAFNQTEYDRVLSLDSDALLLQPMDELFSLPKSRVAMPRAYWLINEGERKLASHVMLVTPDAFEFQRLREEQDKADINDYDMELVNALYRDSALVLPHRPYAMLTSEFRKEPHKHAAYLGSDREAWDPAAVYNEATYIHFSDWPVPKPWLAASPAVVHDAQPKCHSNARNETTCVERDIWNGLYSDFAGQRARVCFSVGTNPSKRDQGMSRHWRRLIGDRHD